jgi:hypothetical protein
VMYTFRGELSNSYFDDTCYEQQQRPLFRTRVKAAASSVTGVL